MNKKEKVRYWIGTSDKDYKSMNNLYNSKEYHWSLFVGHLCIEKLLKALYVKKHNDHPPMTHNCIHLADKCALELDDEKVEQLATINSFNIRSRYQDYKEQFYRLCTKKYTSEWVENIKSLRSWIKKQL